MNILKTLWREDKALVIVAIIAILAILYYIWRQNNGSSAASATTDANMPTTESEQLSTILAALGQLTPVTNTIQSAPITQSVTVTQSGTPQSVTTTVTQVQSQTTTASGIGNDAARDAAIKAAEAKYYKPSQAAQLQAAIAAIKAQYPRSGTTIG